MTQTIELLSTQHQDVLAHLATVESTLRTADTASLAAFATYLENEVGRHFDLEEQALFPALARHLSPDSGPLAVMNAEHALFRELLAGLAAAVRANDVAAQRAHAAELVDLLRAHIAKEDHVLFPMAVRLLSPAEQTEVNERAIIRNSAVPA
ncbi:MAG TPA: hemerythrin domain-containing protein [Candidatus Kryptonia bacterium]|nr:hemerythrin domain-containing protein [Candidatus Kryptonia bacterium]